MPCVLPAGATLLDWAARQLGSGGDLRVASECLEMAPESSHRAYLRGGVALLQGDSHGAIRQFRTAVRLAPHADAYFELGNSLFGERELPEAERAFQAALIITPTHPLCYLNLGNVYSEQRRAGLAERNFRLALALAPRGTFGSCGASNGLSNLLEQDPSRVDEARRVNEVALEAAGVAQCHYAAHNLGRLERSAGRFAAAVRYARQAYAVAPLQREYVIGLGAALHSAGAYREASVLYRRAVGQGSSDHRLTIDLANVLHQEGRHAESLEA